MVLTYDDLIENEQKTWIERDLRDLNILMPCKECSNESIAVGNGYCLDCYLQKLKDILVYDYPVSGSEVLDKFKSKGLDI